MGAARDVGKGLVDGNPLDEGREIADHLDGGVAQPLVFLEMPADKGELRTEFARLPSRHAAADPEGLGFVGSGKHNPATDGNGSAAQRRVKQLLYGGIEGIQVRMEDGGCRCHLGGSRDILQLPSISRSRLSANSTRSACSCAADVQSKSAAMSCSICTSRRSRALF